MRYCVLDHKLGNIGGEGAWAPCHVYRVAFWVRTPDELLGRGPVTILVPSRASAPHGGRIKSNVEGANCATCDGGKEPLTHFRDATPDEVADIRSGKILEFVIDEAGGHIPDAFDHEEVRKIFRSVLAEVEAGVAAEARRHAAPQHAFIGMTGA